MQADPINLRSSRHPVAASLPARRKSDLKKTARGEARGEPSTARLAEALRNQLRDLQAQQRAIGLLLERLED